ncbi:hypothetical protein QN277_007321 [Acacia crassicarpa]|uniref:Uncharacterized protein n=1 Tax=Acacia crassicarpa TaxID=499986 RepID=A0AAE1IUZ8_9FABA|nr:hypothetical protein QN277_007321 [Acacia crassicarpa]
MVADGLPAQGVTGSTAANSSEKLHRSIFELPPDFFHSCRLLASPQSSASDNLQNCNDSIHETLDLIENAHGYGLDQAQCRWGSYLLRGACWLWDVIRNNEGKWVAGFSRFLGSCSVFEAES